ncbi:MAG: LysM peptidoglycan-binding domain-containing protein [Chloroflexi bacterium]|nr:LysM peptidoglycan-binding domain-containing protein [Chloroflexota bacterium]
MMRRLTCIGLIIAFSMSALWPMVPAHASPSNQGTTTHTVAWGETMFSIAQYYGTSVEAICAANGIVNPASIYAGQRLVISAASAPPSPATGGGTHVVGLGENLYRIALRYGTTVQVLAQLNGITDPNQVFVGQTLRITGNVTSPATPSQPVGATTTTHIVQYGETLAAIALQYDVTMWILIEANSITNPALIFPGQELTIPEAHGSTTTSTPVSTGGAKRIVVDVSDQHLYAYQGETLVYSYVASTGKPGVGTSTGSFSVLNKIPNAYASTWDLQMPYWMGIYWSGGLQNGIHALPILSNGQQLWAGYLGTPISYGCIVLGTYEASLLYQWADVGTPVVVRY